MGMASPWITACPATKGWDFSRPWEEAKMNEPQLSKPIEFHVFGSLRRHLERKGLPYALTKNISEESQSALECALSLDLPPGEIEAVFRNGKIINIHDPVFPGDRVAFFPQGTPGPYRLFLGMIRENIERTRRETPK